MTVFKITACKLAQFTRATCTGGSEHIGRAYLEAEEGLLDAAIASYQADQNQIKWDLRGGLVMPLGPAA